MKIFIDGKFYSKEDAKISVFDHGLLYGDGIFEGLRAYNGVLFKLDEHIDRFFESAKSLSLKLEYSYDEVKQIVADTCKENGLKDAYIRLVATRGVGDLGLNPASCPSSSLICIAGTIKLFDREVYERGISVTVSSYQRSFGHGLDPQIKSLNYLNSILSKLESTHAKSYDSIFLNSQGYVTECSVENIFIVKDGVLITPHASAGILMGITRGFVMDLAKELDIEVREELFTLHNLLNADEFFLTGTGAEMMPVVAVRDTVIGDGKPGPITKRLSERFVQKREEYGETIQY